MIHLHFRRRRSKRIPATGARRRGVEPAAPDSPALPSPALLDPALLDPAVLARLQALLPPERLSALLERGMAEIRGGTALLAVDAPPAEAADILHRLGSVAGNLGLLALMALCRDDEARWRAGGAPAPGQGVRLQEAAQSALAALEDWRRDA